MKRLIAIAVLIFLPFGSAWADTHTADSCSRTDVNTAISAAANGDIVYVPAGDCEWTSGIEITNAIDIRGATTTVSATSSCTPASETCIRVNLAGVNGPLGGADNAIFWFAPDATAVAAVDELTETATIGVSGITFTGDSTSYKYAIQIYNHTNPKIRRVRIHHNKFVTLNRAVGGPHGYVHGLFDNNTLYDTNTCYAEGASYGSFDNDRSLPGSGKGWYVEDNTIVSTGSVNDVWIGGGNNEGGAIVYRYNSFSGVIAGTCDYIDIHGNQIGINAGQFTEIYGNNITATLSGGACNRLTYVRGGQVREFYNIMAGTGGKIQVVEEYGDEYSNDGHPDNRCTTPGGESKQVCTDSCICQKVHNSYFWNNRRTTSGSVVNAETTTGSFNDGQRDDYYHLNNNVLNDPPEVDENTEFYNMNASFDGTTGVGCGTLAGRPATCTTGVGYWATTQSCSDLTGMVGVSPTTPISGTLYKCTSTNTWTAYYTPYTYPHPLRGPFYSTATIGAGPTWTLGSGATATIH